MSDSGERGNGGYCDRWGCFAASSSWSFWRTRSTSAGRRVEEAARNHTAHPASVFVSLQDGWHYGSGMFEFLADMKGTHGSARATSTLGFVASNTDPLPDTLRAEEVYPWFGLAREPEPPPPFVDPCPR